MGSGSNCRRGWQLREVRILRYGYEPVAATVQAVSGQAGTYDVLAGQPLRGGHELVFRVQTGELPGRALCVLTPLLRHVRTGRVQLERQDALQVTAPVSLRQAFEGENRVLAFDPATVPLLLRRQAVPDLGLRAAFTVEFWLRTTGLNEVVLSTWTGEERTAYPLELVVDGRGRFLAYYGQPGRHHALRTQHPVADGRWHHVAVTNDPAAGWTRLYLDGQPADSLFHELLPFIDMPGGVAVGGRLPAPGRRAGGRPFTGRLDELRLWARSRTRAEIRRTMHEPLPDLGGQGVVLGFEQPVPEHLIDGRPPRLRRQPADLDFFLPVRNLRGTVDEQGIRLTWETEDRQTEAFIVERSGDGRHFEEVGRLEPGAAAAGVHAPGGAVRFSFFDPDPGGGVRFYRIRQRFRNGSERVSGTIKMGLGGTEEPDALLIGNFPNPFNPATTISYSLQKRQHVRLAVWDLSGQLVAVLVDEEQGEGYHEVHFEAGDLPSGTYFIHLRTAGGVQTRQMVLAK
ncbi:MAG: hypothetical protein KatS3mg043_2070 [Rhodothermaceae bacterium]|nr:MAG: hypothetical protein KatS3mg043_2070 [Rhodothermaceae bacterium]